jgi:hypothetical protein
VALGAFLLLRSPSVEQSEPAREPRQGAAWPPSQPASRKLAAPRVPSAVAPAAPSPGAERLTPRDERLVRSAGLAPAGESTVARLLETYSAEELAVMARVERLTGDASSPALLELSERRRAGASAAELVDAATRLFAGDPLSRAAALEWVRTTVRTSPPHP